jgi:hypothetical protein
MIRLFRSNTVAGVDLPFQKAIADLRRIEAKQRQKAKAALRLADIAEKEQFDAAHRADAIERMLTGYDGQ